MSESRTVTLADKRAQWLDALAGSDRHAIIRQLWEMTWDAATFRVVNEARRLAPPAPEGGVQLNGLVHSLIDKGFFALHMLGVRRLMDTYRLEGGRGVYSLRGLLEDLQKQRCLLSRRAIFDAEGRVYDDPHEERHRVIDTLSGTAPDERQPDDTICESVLNNLLQKATAASETIDTYVNKFIAHAAIPESRAIVHADTAKITLSHLWTAHKQLCEVVSFVSVCLLGHSSFGLLAHSRFDQFEYIHTPLVDLSQVDHLRQMWESVGKEFHRWGQWGLNNYVEEFP